MNKKQKKDVSSFGILKRILTYTKPYTFYLVFTLISAVISACATLYAPVLIGNAIDHIVEKGNVDFQKIFPIIIQLIVVVLVGAAFQWFMGYCTNILTHGTVRDLRVAAFNKLENVPLKYIDTTPHGDIIGRVVADIDTVSDGLLQGFQQLFTGIVTIIGTLCFMLSINLSIALVVIVITPVSLLVASTIARLCSKKFKEQAALRGKITALAEEYIGNQKVVKAFCYEENSEAEFEKLNAELNKVGTRAQFYSALTNPCTRFVNGLVYAGVGIFGAFNSIGGGISIGQLSCFLSYANQYTKPFNEISGVVTELQSAFASARRIFAMLDSENEVSDIENETLKNVQGDVNIKNVDFSYTPDRELIKDLCLDVKKGQQIAIVGPTGCGKTTIINLLMRFYDTNSGSISVDNKDIKTLTRDSLRLNYGMVLQETWIFKGTVRENIAYGKPDASEEEIINAAKAAHCHSFIKRLKYGYDTVISDTSGLSQGQKQLLCIARIMLTMPPMLILDEATSSIDTRTELQIQSAFAKMTKGKTNFIVAHRLSTIKNADTILVMDKGKIIEIGNHEELLEKGGFYFNLYNSQFKKS
ncbi:MAG: ABC transporter ATP-binding protein [Ruminococcaceae bacterium]|nr:ABC transporter ATP-binding protein [Oscillospiraceae bacterium]